MSKFRKIVNELEDAHKRMFGIEVGNFMPIITDTQKEPSIYNFHWNDILKYHDRSEFLKEEDFKV